MSVRNKRRSRFRAHHGFLLLLIALIGCGIYGINALSRWISGQGCRTTLQTMIGRTLQVEASLEPVRLQWIGIASGGLHAKGTGATPLREIEASDVQGKLKPSSLLNGLWRIKEISLGKLRLRLGGTSSPSVPGTAKAEDAALPFPIPKWFPSVVVIDVISSPKSDLLIELPEGKVIELLDTRLEMRPDGAESSIEARGGTLRTPVLPDLELRTARCRSTAAGLRLTGADLTFPSGGTVRMEGMFPSDSPGSSLRGTWEKVPVHALIPALEGKVTGTFHGSCDAAWDANGLHSVSGTMQAVDVTLGNLPQLGQIADFTGMEQFRSVPLQEARGTYERLLDTTRWSDIVLESRGLLKLTGEATVKETGELSGNFRLGLTTAIVRTIPMAAQLLGANESEGFLWIPLKVGGTLDHPTDDLAPRLMTAVTAKAAGEIRKGIDTGLEILGIKPSQGLPDGAAGGASNPATLPPAATNAVKTLQRDAGTALDALGGFLK